MNSGDVEKIDYDQELILVVDDDDAVREPLVQMLLRLGFKTESVDNATDALTRLNEKNFSFLLTDIRMPGVDGLELIKRAKGEHNDLCIIAMTGFSREYKYIDVINAGATDFINKPFGVGEIEAKVKRAIIERNIKDELSRLSITDSLTGLFNQRHFYARLRDEVTRAARQKNQLSLILIDLDDFKQYNDTYGHVAGDELLKRVGKIINANIRQGVDSGYRYGGDEFAIILIDADMKIGHHIAQRIEEAILDECELRTSYGYANYEESMDLEAFVKTTDQFLYAAKRENKNKRAKG